MKQPDSIWNYQLRSRAAEHPDGVFSWLDLDHDQFLSSREIGLATARLTELLGDAPQIRPTEIPDTLFVQFGRGEPEQDATQFELRRKQKTSNAGRPAWASRMDSNADGEVSQNEFLGPVEAFEKLDGGSDQYLSAKEIERAK